jgi:hypothetical protein
MTDINWQLQPGPCVICAAVNYPLSMGGPTICPSCDCGNFGPEVLKKQGKAFTEIVARLQTDNKRLLDALKAIECHSIDHTDACRMAGKARAAQERKP